MCDITSMGQVKSGKIVLILKQEISVSDRRYGLHSSNFVSFIYIDCANKN